jgi:chromosome segregation ATPase
MAITKQEVFNAAAAIVARGSKPTLNDIRNELGAGNFTMINDALVEWRTAQKATIAAIPSSIRESAPDSISNRLNDLADDVWEIALQVANERLQFERDAMEQTKREINQAQQETAELADAVCADLEIAKTVIKQHEESAMSAVAEFDRLNREISTLTNSLVKANHETQSANAVLSESHQRVEQLTAMLDSEKAERINASKKLEQALITIAELNANVTEFEGNLNVMTGRATVAEAKSNQTNQTLNDVTKKLDKSVNEYQVLQNKLILAESQMLFLKEQVSELKIETKKAIEDAAELRGKLSFAS